MLLALALLTQQFAKQNFAVIDRPGADPAITASLRKLCPAIGPIDSRSLLDLERRQALVADGKRDADAWLALACTRAWLATTGKFGVLSHDGPLMISGDSWAQGAASTAMEVLSIRPDDHRAAEMLGMYSLDESDPRFLKNAAAMLGRAAADGRAGSAALRACAELNMRIEEVDIARRCAMLGLVAGRDSTSHLLVLARLGFRTHDTVQATATFLRAAAVAHDSISRLALGWHLQWFLGPGEDQEWLTVPDSGHSKWVRDRLTSRDVRDGRPLGARLAEHFSRLEYVEQFFRLRVPREYHDVLRTAPNSVLPDTTPIREYIRWQVDFDDRGVVWMRFGAPLKIAVWIDSTPDPLTAREAWRYEIDGRSMMMHFQYEKYSGSVSGSTLRAGVLRDFLCSVDSWHCTMSLKRDIGSLTLDDLKNVVAQDRADIATATTRDDNSPRGDTPIEVTSRLHRLWDPVNGVPLALVTYAVKANDLATEADGPHRTAAINFDFRRWDATTEEFKDSTFTRRLELPDSNSKQLHATGFFATRSSPDVSSWSLVATQPDKRRGRAWDVTTPGLDHGAVALSDLVLGQEGQGVVWNIHNVDVLLAPLNAVDRKKPVSLYYQVRSAEASSTLHTIVAFYRINAGVTADSAALQLGFDQPLKAGINEVAPTLDVSRLEHGSYRLEVRLTDDRGRVVSRRSVELNLD